MIVSAYLFLSMWCNKCGRGKADHPARMNVEKSLENSSPKDHDLNKPEATGGMFRDDFRFRLELTVGLVVKFVTVLYHTFLINRYPVGESSEYKYGLILGLIGTFVGLSAGVLAMTIIPYYTWREHVSLFEAKTPKTEIGCDGDEYRVIGLLDVLRHKSGFYAFVDHLVQELSFENLSYLIAVYQFKYVNSTDVETSMSMPMSTSMHPVHSMSMHSVLSEHANAVTTEYFRRVLQKMPWDGLPLTNSGTQCSKLQQAQNLFDKYVNRGSYHSVNISPDSVLVIQGLMQRLHAYVQQRPTAAPNGTIIQVNCDPDVIAPPVQSKPSPNIVAGEMNASTVAPDEACSELQVRDDLKEADNIRDEQHFNSILINIFDSSLSDIFHNLEGSMTRFRITDEFLKLSGKQ